MMLNQIAQPVVSTMMVRRFAARWVMAIIASLLMWATFPALGAEDVVYVAKDGDTLISIARNWMSTGEDWQAHRDLARHNRLRDADRIRAGRQIRIPVEWLRRETLAGKVKRVQGSASSAGVALVVGASLAQGAGIQTGPDGYVSLELGDGSELVVAPDTDLRIDAHRRYQNTGAFEAALRLLKGAVDALISPARGPGARFEINSEQAVAAVRGTVFRVRADASAGATRSEVLQGSVTVSNLSREASVVVEPGFGTVVDATQRPLPPVRLLAAPDLSAIQKLHERVVVRLRFPAVADAAKYRAVLSRDSAFSNNVREDVLASAEARYGDLPDGDYYFRLRGIDRVGLEGIDGVASFRLKARPEPPFPSAPQNRAKLRALTAEFAWSTAAEAASYRFQLARDAGFASVVTDRNIAGAQRYAPQSLDTGEYFWRIASVRANADQGPWGDTQRFTLLPPPPDPEPPAVSDGKTRFSWSGEPGQKFQFQLARDAAFAQVLRAQELTAPTLELADLDPGRYYMRYRATDPDGFVGPFTSAQSFEVPKPPPPEPEHPWWLLLLLLVPLL